ncbi:MAG: Hpt domain-containing protein, partial [Sphingomicrobium sp.]
LELLTVELDERPAEIRRAIVAGDLEAARRQAHSLKGATTSIGALALGQAAADLERAPDLESMAAMLKVLDRQTARTRRAVEALLPGKAPKRLTG